MLGASNGILQNSCSPTPRPGQKAVFESPYLLDLQAIASTHYASQV